jgi:hypothetical protein
MIKGWFETWRVLSPLLNETARFIQNDAVSYILKKKQERAERCRFERHCSSSFFPPNMQRGRRKKGLL